MADAIEKATPHSITSSGTLAPAPPCRATISTVPPSAAASTASNAASTRSRPRSTATPVTSTGGRHSAISVGTAAPMRAMPRNQHSTYEAMHAPAPTTRPSCGLTARHSAGRPNTASSTAAPTTKRQNEMLSGLCAWRAISTLTTSAPVPHRKPAKHAAAIAAADAGRLTACFHPLGSDRPMTGRRPCASARIRSGTLPAGALMSFASAGGQGRVLEIGLGQGPPRRTHELQILLCGWPGWYPHDCVIAIGRNDGPRVSTEALRVLSCLNGANAPPDLLSEHRDPAIRGSQVLQPMDGDRPLSDLRLIVSRAALTRLIGSAFRELAGEHDVAVGPPGRRDAVGLAHAAEFDEHRAGVVLGHNPGAHQGAAKGMLPVAVFPDRRHLLQVGQHRFDHPGPDVLAHSSRGDVDHAHRGLDEIQFRHLAELLGELRAADNGMKERRVNGIHGVLHDLQPVARIEILPAGDESIAGPLEAIVQRERRSLVRRPD